MEFDLLLYLQILKHHNGCEPQIHQFNNTSFQITPVFDWDFGDGSSSNLENPSHTFQEAGTYNVQLNKRYSGM